jgi:uncharacterized phage protein (TIGR01671 family)
MREIKFRAWDERQKIMHGNFQFIRSGVESNDCIVFTSDHQTLQSKPHPLENPYFQQQLKVMQYTGLKDKFGVEIYEGDIVSYQFCGQFSHSGEGVVEFAHGCFHVLRFLLWDYSEDGKDWQIEVIGDIHQNPELLGAT